MSNIVNAAGTVASITPRAVNTRYGEKTTYTVVLSDGTKFDTSFKAPDRIGLVVGGTCEVVLENSKYGLKFKDTGSVHGAASAQTAAAAAPVATREPGFPVPKNSDKLAIIRQNALTNAVSWYNTNIVEDHDDPPTDEETAERIIGMAYRFAEYTSGHREVKALEELTNGGN